MSTTLNTPPGAPAPLVAGEKCRVAVTYEATSDRQRAVCLCHHLADRFWEEVDFEFSWWRFRYLEDPEIADAAGCAARAADIIVVAAPVMSEPPAQMLDWFNFWAPLRTNPNGVLLPLLAPANPEEMSLSPWISLLDELSRQTGLECLLPSQMRESAQFASPTRPLQQRAQHVSGVLNHILNTLGGPPPPPHHWGLNE